MVDSTRVQMLKFTEKHIEINTTNKYHFILCLRLCCHFFISQRLYQFPYIIFNLTIFYCQSINLQFNNIILINNNVNITWTINQQKEPCSKQQYIKTHFQIIFDLRIHTLNNGAFYIQKTIALMLGEEILHKLQKNQLPTLI